MRILLFCIATIFFCSVTDVLAQRPFPDSAEAVFNKAMNEINPRYVTWIRTVAVQVNQKKMTEAEVMQMTTTQWPTLGNMNGQDIEALCFLVLMQASKSAQEDLKAIMAKVKSINEQKAKQRELLSRMRKENTMSAIQLDSFKLMSSRTKALQKGSNPDTIKFVRSASVRRTISKTDMDIMAGQIKNDLDSMSEMGEMESLRLQMSMDRMSKMMSTLSNLLKKISDTAQSIIQNLK